MLGWMDVARQGWPLASETERNSDLVSFISVKAAMGSGGSIEMLSANAGALGGHEVARDGPAGLGSGWRWAVVLCLQWLHLEGQTAFQKFQQELSTFGVSF